MSEFTRIGGTAELPKEGTAREFDCGGKMLCVANVNGVISALDNVCLHQGGPLGQGTIEDGKLVCPWHGWSFDPQTGKMGEAGFGVKVYPLRVEGNDVLVDLDGAKGGESS